MGIGIGCRTCNGLFIKRSGQTSSQFMICRSAANAIVYNYAGTGGLGCNARLQYHGPQELMNR
jgi:hypothetical protein